MGQFFKHFKGKPYRYLFTAKFSEDLSEMAVYETMYENSEGKLWVRPKKMFDESVTRDGKTRPRFAKVALQFNSLEDVNDLAVNQKIITMVQDRLAPLLLDQFVEKLKNRRNLLILTCEDEGQLLGFKVGFEQEDDSSHFYSWIGAVARGYERLGIASELMRLQHDFAKSRGYKTVMTKSEHLYPEMIYLNLKSGFEIDRVDINEAGTRKIVFLKNL